MTDVHARPFPTAAEIRASYAETRSVPLTAARCGVSIDVVRDTLLVPRELIRAA